MLALVLVAGAIAAVPGPDATLAELFPDRSLTNEEAAALLTPARIGPPARVYDQTTRTPGAAKPEELALEAAVGVGEPAPDSLRRFGRLELGLLRHGNAHNVVHWFLAEHVGLTTVPVGLGTFYTNAADPVKLRGVLDDLVERDPDLRSVAVTLEHDDAKNVWVGLVTGLYAAARFEPFPRVYRPGDVAVVPGTLLSRGDRYGLYVTYPGTEVREFPLEGDGAFDVEVPLPTQAGVYRVAMNRQKRKHELPDSAFFFSLYVGQDPPATLDLASIGIPKVADAGTPEETFLAALNEARARYAVPPLAWVDRLTEMRTLLAGLPSRPLAQWRWVRQVSRQDPMPGVPHGAWTPGWMNGDDPLDAAWSMIEHPITRETFLDPANTLLTAGGVSPGGHGLLMLAFAVAPADDVQATRDAALVELQRRWGTATKPTVATKLQGSLDVVAAEVASGKRAMNAAMKDVKGIVDDAMKAGTLTGPATWTIVAVPAGGEPNLGTIAIGADMHVTAVGAARGDLGRGAGLQFTVLVIVVAGSGQ